MRRLLGVIALVLILLAVLMRSGPNARSLGTIQNIVKMQGEYGILTLGVGVLIIVGGIDLSMGSVLALSAVGFVILMRAGVHPYLAMAIVLLGGVLIGLINGLLVTQLNLQPFLVTLCGLFVYRGLARVLAGGRDIGRNDANLPAFTDPLNDLTLWWIGKDANGRLLFPAVFVLLLILTLFVAWWLHASVYGRYLYAIGHNEKAAQYAGIRTTRHKLCAYMFCSFTAALGGVLYLLDKDTVSPASAGQLYELYAITGAVLGGCSLRGGEGTAAGILIGTAVFPLLHYLTIFRGVNDAYIPAIIGSALLLGTIADQFFRRGKRS